MNNIDYSLLKGTNNSFLAVYFLSHVLYCLWFSFSQLSKQEQMMGNTQSDMDYAEEEINRLNNLVSLFENFNGDYKKYEAKGFFR